MYFKGQTSCWWEQSLEIPCKSLLMPFTDQSQNPDKFVPGEIISPGHLLGVRRDRLTDSSNAKCHLTFHRRGIKHTTCLYSSWNTCDVVSRIKLKHWIRLGSKFTWIHCLLQYPCWRCQESHEQSLLQPALHSPEEAVKQSQISYHYC